MIYDDEDNLEECSMCACLCYCCFDNSCLEFCFDCDCGNKHLKVEDVCP